MNMGKTLIKTFIMCAMILSAQAQAHAQSPAAPAAAPLETPATVPPESAAIQGGAVSATKPVVLSFVEWKSLRVHEAQQKLEQASSTQTTQVEKFVGSDKVVEQKLNFNVDVALQLNIQDYFSMYLKNLSKEEFKEATKKMNQEEVSELLLAYKSSQETKSPGLKFSKSEKR
jgi:hypothetical protein